MNLAVDIGNSYTHISLFKGKKIALNAEIGTYSKPDKISRSFKPFIKFSDSVDDIGISSVVPGLDSLWIKLTQKYFKKSPLIINYKSKLPLKLNVKNPSKLGADRICNSVFGYEYFNRKKNVIVIDMGSAITFDVILSTGVLEGGIIALGVDLSSKALNQFTGKLPKLEFSQQVFPKSVIGKNTVSALQSGLMNYSLSAIEGLVKAIESEKRVKFEVILSGGTARFIRSRLKRKVYFIENSVLPGINYILNYQKSLKK